MASNASVIGVAIAVSIFQDPTLNTATNVARCQTTCRFVAYVEDDPGDPSLGFLIGVDEAGMILGFSSVRQYQCGWRIRGKRARQARSTAEMPSAAFTSRSTPGPAKRSFPALRLQVLPQSALHEAKAEQMRRQGTKQSEPASSTANQWGTTSEGLVEQQCQIECRHKSIDRSEHVRPARLLT